MRDEAESVGSGEPAGADAGLLDRDAAVFFHQQGSSPCLAALRAVDGPWIEDTSGRRFIDLHGNTVHHLGHAHPEIVAALKDQLDALAFSPRRFTNRPATELAERLAAKWPDGPARVLFAPGGSEAIEIAVKLARVATGRSATISLEGSYHGHGFGAYGLSRARPDPRLGSFLPDRRHATPYWDLDAGGAEATLRDIRQALAETPGGVAAVVAEPMRSNCHVPPPALWREVRALCDAAGALLIFDEIPSGLGKTGRFFAFEHFGAVPDIAVLGKALGGGVLPIAAVLAHARLDIAPELSLGHYTHEKNPLTARAALTTLAIIERDGLARRAERLGGRVRERVTEISQRSPAIRGVRGLGLLLAIELDAAAFPDHLRSRPSAGLVEACFRHGVSTTTKGHEAIGFSPPLTIAEAELELSLSRIEAAVEELVGKSA